MNSVLVRTKERDDTVKRDSCIEIHDAVREKAKSFLEGAQERESMPLRQNVA